MQVTIKLYPPNDTVLVYPDATIDYSLSPDLTFTYTDEGGFRHTVVTTLGYIIERPPGPKGDGREKGIRSEPATFDY